VLKRKLTSWQPVNGIEHIESIHIVDHEIYQIYKIPLKILPDAWEYTNVGGGVKFNNGQNGMGNNR